MDKESNIATIDKDINIVTYEVKDIEERIYTIRGKQVMLDRDVAILYHYETRRINEAVKRNIGRFPEDFCFKSHWYILNNLYSVIFNFCYFKFTMRASLFSY